jgi:hypothetical protein
VIRERTRVYDPIIDRLPRSYDLNLEERDATQVAGWKLMERQQFLSLLQSGNKTGVLDLRAGTGVHEVF